MNNAQRHPMKFGSLFSGIGGFDLGFERAGMTCAWQVEIDEKARGVLGRHWPNVPKYEDVKNVGRHNLEPVDVICGGFPCQDLSVAGQRKGLAGERSGLWFEFHRILAEIKPRWVVIENVPGLLSSNKGRDFAVILSGLVKLGYGVCWRILDAQYFGVPQRRRRVFIVGHLGDGRAAQVLFEREGSAWNPPPSRETGQGFARDVAPCLAASGRGTERTGESRGQGAVIAAPIAGTLAAGAHPGSYNGRDAGRGMLVSAPLTNKPYADNDAQHTKLVASPLQASLGHHGHSSPRGDGSDNLIAYQCHGSNVGPMGTLREGNGGLTGGVPFVAFDTTQITSPGNYSKPKAGDPCHPLAAGAHPPAVAFQPRYARNGRGAPDTIAAPLTAEAGRTGKGDSATCVAFDWQSGGDVRHNCSEHHTSALSKSQVPAVGIFDTPTDTLYNKGITQEGESNASTQETDTRAILSELRRKVGAEAFTEWGLGILDSLQQAQILQPAMHGSSVQAETKDGQSVLRACAPESEGDCRTGTVREMWIARCLGCASQRWELEEQPTRELGAYLSQLSQQGPPQAKALRDLWQASEGLGVLQQALSEIQEVWKPANVQAEPAHAPYGVRRLTPTEAERLQGFSDGHTAGQSDSARYRQLGNAVEVDCAEWIGHQLLEVLE